MVLIFFDMMVRQIFNDGVYFTAHCKNGEYWVDWATPYGRRKGQYGGVGNVKMEKEKYARLQELNRAFEKKCDKEENDFWKWRDTADITSEESARLYHELLEKQKEKKQIFLRGFIEG